MKHKTIICGFLIFGLQACAPEIVEYSDDYFTKHVSSENVEIRLDYDLTGRQEQIEFNEWNHDVVPLVIETAVDVAEARGYAINKNYFSDGHVLYTDDARVLNDTFLHFQVASDDRMDYSETFAAFIHVRPHLLTHANYLIVIDARNIYSQEELEGVVLHEITHAISKQEVGRVDVGHENAELWSDFQAAVKERLQQIHAENDMPQNNP